MLYINYDLCTGCGRCVDVCAFGALAMQNNRVVVDQGLCEMCNACVNACPKGAIALTADQPAFTANAALNQPGFQNAPAASAGFFGKGKGMGRGMGGGRGAGRGSGGNRRRGGGRGGFRR